MKYIFTSKLITEDQKLNTFNMYNSFKIIQIEEAKGIILKEGITSKSKTKPLFLRGNVEAEDIGTAIKLAKQVSVNFLLTNKANNNCCLTNSIRCSRLVVIDSNLDLIVFNYCKVCGKRSQ